MTRLKVVTWMITLMLHVLLISYSNASDQNKLDVDSELSRIFNLPVASKEEVTKIQANEQTRVQSLGNANLTNPETIKKMLQAYKENDWKKYIELNQRILAIDSNNLNALGGLSVGYTLGGAPDKGLEFSAKALKRLRASGKYMIVAAAYARKGDKDKSLLWLEKAYDGGYSFPNAKFFELYFPKSLKYQDDPKFKTITARNFELIKHCEPFSNFLNKYVDATLVSPEALVANPFVYEGKTVKLFLDFAAMETATTAIFNKNSGGVSMPVALFDGVPKGLYTQKVSVLVVGRVIGKITKKFSAFDFPLVHLKYIEALKEPPSGCSG